MFQTVLNNPLADSFTLDWQVVLHSVLIGDISRLSFIWCPSFQLALV